MKPLDIAVSSAIIAVLGIIGGMAATLYVAKFVTWIMGV
jgi:hypothetical protein